MHQAWSDLSYIEHEQERYVALRSKTVSELDAVRQQAVALENVICERQTLIGIQKKKKKTGNKIWKNLFLSPIEPSKTFGLWDGTRTAIVNMSRARIGSWQNGFARWTASRVVRTAPQRRSVAQDAPTTAHYRRYYNETATDHRRYNNMQNCGYYIMYYI